MHRIQSCMLRWCLAVAGVLGLAGLGGAPAARAAALTVAFGPGDLDTAQCKAYVDGRDAGAIPESALRIFCGAEPGRDPWAVPPAAAKRRDFRIALKSPVTLGTVCTQTYTGPERQPLGAEYGRFLSILKPEAPYPGDVTREADWIVLPRGAVKTMAPGTITRALRITTLFADPAEDGHWAPNARLTPVLCLKERAYNPLAGGVAPHSGGKKAGPNVPDSWMYDWQEARPLGGLLLQVNYESRGEIRFETLKTAVTTAPGVTAKEDWDALPQTSFAPGINLISGEKPVLTRAARVTGLWTASPTDERMRGFLVPLVCLAENETPPVTVMPPPPVAIQYEMPFAGIAALQIHDKQSGKLVRRLFAESPKDRGPATDAWDLKDDSGTFVGPGDYAWKAFVRPPFKLTYELTVNNAGQPGWWAPPPGKGGGGWLGDHGTPNCAAAMGDVMWFGSLCAENGHAAIATDLDGNKLWGTHHIAWGFRGPAYIAADSQAAYLVCPELVNRVVPSRDFQMRTIFNAKPTPELPWNPIGYDATTGGAAARDGKLYFAINAPPESWLKSAFFSDALDPGRCVPGIGLFKGKGQRAMRGDKNYDEGEYDELMKLYACFLTERTPQKTPTFPDTVLPSSKQAWFGDAASDGELAGSVVVVFKNPVTVGSVLVPDAAIRVFALRPGVNPDEFLKPKAAGELKTETPKKDKSTDELDEMVSEMKGQDAPEGSLWIPFKAEDTKPGKPGIVAAPAGGVKTLALRYQVRRLLFSQVVTHRLRNVAPAAKRVFTEGAATATGGWLVERGAGKMINEYKPATAALVWPEAQPLRGVSFTQPLLVGKGAGFVVEAWTGGAGDPAAALAKDSGWEKLGTVVPDPNFNGYFAQEPACRQLDFGRVVNSTALRIRALSGVEDRTGFAGIVVWTPAGDDPKDLPVCMNERIAVLKMPPLTDDKSEATVEKNIPVPRPNSLAFDAQGTLYCVSDGRVVTVPLDGAGEPKVLVAKGQVAEPRGLAVDARGFIYLADGATKTIKVFDPKTGTLARTIGKGEQQPGKWDPARLDNPMQIAVDKRGKLWVSDASYQPKRVQRFAADGSADQAFLGPTQYGGGGWLDERDISKIYYNGMRFIIDWPTHTWRLDSLIFRQANLSALQGVCMPERVIYLGKHRYMVGPPRMGDGRGQLAVVAQERGDIAVPLAAIGCLADWGDVGRRADLRDKFGAMDGTGVLVLWCDRNGDGQPQVDEVQTQDAPGGTRGDWVVGEDLTLYTVGAKGVRLRPTSIRDDGVPLYDLKNIETFTTFTHGPGARTQNILGTADGRIFMIGTRLIAPDGQNMLWEYYNAFACHEGFYHSGFGYNRPPGVLNQEHKIVGHFRLGEEEYFFTNTDQGDWFCFTGDGMFAGCVFGGPAGFGLRSWTMPEWEPGKVDLSDVRMGQEHYQGCIVRTQDNKVYAVAGHNHMSVVRVEGLEQAKRLNGTLRVSPEEVVQTREWDVQRQTLASAQMERKALRVAYQKKDLACNGDISAWPKDLFVTIHETAQASFQAGVTRTLHAQAALVYNDQNLFVAAKVLDESPLKNGAQDPFRLFQGGDAFDLTIGLDPKADPRRKAATVGDLRILFSVLKGKPVAVLYKPVAPDAPPSERARFESPVGTTIVDQVKVLPDVKIGVLSDRDGDHTVWTMTAMVPWSSIGAKVPEGGSVLRGDVGVLVGDPNGVVTSTRWYWSGKTQTVVCDVPSETRLVPALWGELHFTSHDLMDETSPNNLIEQGPTIKPDDLFEK